MSVDTTIPVPWGETGLSLYVRIRRRSDGYFYNADTESFEAWNPANVEDYAITLADADGVGFYEATFPTVAAGVYDALLYEYDTTPSVDDDCFGDQEYEWDGSKFVRLKDVPAAVLDETDGVETGLTLRGAIRLALAVLAGRVTGAGTPTNVFRAAVSNSKTRVTSTVDASGNRSEVTTDATP